MRRQHSAQVHSWHSSQHSWQPSDEAFGRRLLFRRSELLGRPSLPSLWLSAHDAFGRTYGLPQILWLCFLGLFFFFTFGLGLLLAQASLIILPGEAGAAVRASASLDGKNCLIHALTRIYVHFFTSILYVNFQFGLNEYSDYLALLLPRSEAAQESDEGEARRLLSILPILCAQTGSGLHH